MWDFLLAAFIFGCAMVAMAYVSDRLIDAFLSWWDRR